MHFKQFILGTGFGDFAMLARKRIALLHAALFRPEQVGTLANDQLAGLLVASICKAGETFLDVGAHIGSVISAVRKHDLSVNIIAVEAVPEKADKLRRKYPNVVVHDCAAGEVNGKTAFYIDKRRTGYSSLISPADNGRHIREIPVTIRRLDDIIPVDVEIDVIKIDVEGSELGALRGAVGLLSRCHPVVMFESGPSGLDSAKSDLFRYFHDRDYAIVVPNRLAHNDSGLTERGFLESHIYPRRATNYFAIHKERRTEIRDRARQILNIRDDSVIGGSHRA